MNALWMDGLTDGQTDRSMDGWMDGPSYRDARTHLTRLDTRPSVAGTVMLKNQQKRYFYESMTDGWMDGPTDQRMDTPSYRDASTRLKTLRVS